jgi:all-trans-retinol 13,14-reductase
MKNNSSEFDAIIIGSGLGSITTAGLLARVYNKRVLVLEKHYEPGGLTHEFKRGPFSWDVGLHYIADMSRRYMDRLGLQLFSFLSGGRLRFRPTPDPFDVFKLPDMTVSLNATTGEYRKEMFRLFPKNKREINRFIRDVQKVRIWGLCMFFSKFLHKPLSGFFKFLCLFNRKLATSITSEYIDSYVKDPKLKTALLMRWGNYGIPPNRSAFMIHAMVEHHYFSGSCFPVGGAEKICSWFEEEIEKPGGSILVNREVTSILIDGGTAVGVEVKNLAAPGQSVTQIFAPIIISGVGARNTYCKLLPTSLNLPIQKKLDNFEHGYSGLNIYIGLRESAEKIGVHGQNFWISPDYDFDSFDNSFGDLDDFKPGYTFVSFPSLKSGKTHGHTAEIVAIFPHELVQKWKESFWKERSAEYYQWKESLITRYIDYVENQIPGFKDLVVYSEMASPLTFEHFSGRSEGAFYGLPAVPERFTMKGLEVKTPVKKLYLTGTDILTNGIMPALFSGMATASYIGGPLGIIKVMSRVTTEKRYLQEKEERDLESLYRDQESRGDKFVATLSDRKETSTHVIELTFTVPGLPELLPGQHVKLMVADGEWRAYSIAQSTSGSVTLIIDTRPGGPGSRLALESKCGDVVIMRLPLTDLYYHESKKNLLFVATGTGFVPFIHLMDELKKRDIRKSIIILFGCLREEDNFINGYIESYRDFFDIKSHICVDTPEPGSSDVFHGRIPDFIDQSTYSYSDYDAYICGHPAMTRAVTAKLREKGVSRLYW